MESLGNMPFWSGRVDRSRLGVVPLGGGNTRRGGVPLTVFRSQVPRPTSANMPHHHRFLAVHPPLPLTRLRALKSLL